MKKPLKRLNERKIMPATEERAAKSDDGEIVTRRKKALNKNYKQNATSGASQEIKKCRIMLRRRVVETFTEHQHEIAHENDRTFATGEQTRELRRRVCRPSLKDTAKKDTIPKGVDVKSTTDSRRKAYLKPPLMDNKQNGPLDTGKSHYATSILKPFVESLRKDADKPPMVTQLVRNRLSLSRIKLGDKDKMLESLSSPENSTVAAEEAESQESEVSSSPKLHDLKNKERSGNPLHELQSERNQKTEADHIATSLNMKNQGIVQRRERESNTKASRDKTPLQKSHETNPEAEVNHAFEPVLHQTQETNTPNKRNNRNEYEKQQKIPRCMVKVLRMKQHPHDYPKPNPIVKRKSVRIRKNLAPALSSVTPSTSTHSTKKPVTEEPSNLSRISPDIFSDHDLNGESDIYAFHTQSSQSEHEDIAADIIEKMKKEGKIKFVKQKTKQSKRIGKHNAVRAANWRSVRKNLSVVETTSKERNAFRLQKKNVLSVKNPPAPSVTVENDDYDDHFDTADNGLNESEPQPTIEVGQAKKRKSDGFSSLAQKVLKEQTAIMSPAKLPSSTNATSALNKRKLLQLAMNFVKDSNLRHSTPNKPPPSSSSATKRQKTISPPGGASSPWRVENENIPRLFYFSRNSDNLPSYSSDVIPSSQPSNGPQKTNELSKNSTATTPSRVLNDSMNISAIHNMSSIRSHENSILNISNIENISPVKNFEDKMKEKSIIVNANPRRGLSERSPLKPINILNVVTLPNRINLNQAPDRLKPSRSNKENVNAKPALLSKQNKSTIETSNNNNNTLKDVSVASDFFGFSDDNENVEDVVEPMPKSKLPSKKRLHQKLIRLKRLLPPKPTRVSYGTIKSIFNSPKKQTDIREMLSSTKTIAGADGNAAETSRILNDTSSDDDVSSIAHEDENTTIADEDLHLFDDLAEPQPSFNASMKIRTYERPKRKAKRIHSFILFQSDSENEDDALSSKAKRTKPDKNKKELTKFVHEFNSMCEEVDKYELVVEKDKSTA